MRRTSLIERLPLALLAALLMGGAVAFFFLAMPIALIERGVVASGLPLILAAAAPPLGSMAQGLVAGVAAIACGGATWVGMTLADKVFRRRPKRPATRHADFIAEPPARRPIFANSVFGSPDELDPPPAAQEAAWGEAPAAADWVDIEFDAGDVLDLVHVLEEPAPAPAMCEPPSIASLMARLEAGARRRAATAVLRPEPPSPPAVPEFDSALRNALNELQRLATR